MYPRSGFRSGGTSAKTTLLETTLLRTPDYGGDQHISEIERDRERQREQSDRRRG